MNMGLAAHTGRWKALLPHAWGTLGYTAIFATLIGFAVHSTRAVQIFRFRLFAPCYGRGRRPAAARGNDFYEPVYQGRVRVGGVVRRSKGPYAGDAQAVCAARRNDAE